MTNFWEKKAQKTHKILSLHLNLPVQSKSLDTEFNLCSDSDCMFDVEAKSSMSFEVLPDTSTILNINTYRLTDTNIMQMENNMLRIYIKNHTISGFEIIMHLSSRDLGNISSTFFHE